MQEIWLEIVLGPRWVGYLIGFPIGLVLGRLVWRGIGKVVEYFQNGCVWINWRKLRRQHGPEGQSHG